MQDKKLTAEDCAEVVWSLVHCETSELLRRMGSGSRFCDSQMFTVRVRPDENRRIEGLTPEKAQKKRALLRSILTDLNYEF
jgi:hypothetical protein